MCSCTTTKSYFQICKLLGDLPVSSSGTYEYSDSICSVNYNFWSNGGDVCFIIHNNTDDVLYIDLTKSFFVKNGIAYDYFQNRSLSSSFAITSSESSSVAGEVLGYWYNNLEKEPGSAEISRGKTIGAQSSYSVKYQEKPVISIPPRSSKVFLEYSIMKNHYINCDLSESPSKEKSVAISFSPQNTPVNFTNFICYRLGESTTDKYIENTFFIATIVNLHPETVTQEMQYGTPSKFYIEYIPSKQNNQNISKRSFGGKRQRTKK